MIAECRAFFFQGVRFLIGLMIRVVVKVKQCLLLPLSSSSQVPWPDSRRFVYGHGLDCEQTEWR